VGDVNEPAHDAAGERQLSANLDTIQEFRGLRVGHEDTLETISGVRAAGHPLGDGKYVSKRFVGATRAPFAECRRTARGSVAGPGRSLRVAARYRAAWTAFGALA
jgi:hypothetical protein